MGTVPKYLTGVIIGATIVFAKRIAINSAFIDSAGAGALSRQEISVLTTGALIYCLVAGKFSHMLLGSKGLGRTAHGSIAFLGVLATVFVYSRLWGAPVADDLPALIGVSVAMSTLAIIAAAFVKMFIVNEATSFSLGNKTSFGTKSGRSSAKGPSADRMNMAMKR